MNTKIKKTFDSIHTETEIKEHTKAFLLEKTEGYSQKRGAFHYRRLLTAAAFLVFITAGSYWLYFFPTAKISIDINPSIELGINRFDHVVSVRGRNDDGKEFLSSLSIKYKEYTEAIHQILNSEKISSLLSKDEILSITVIGSEGKQCSRMLSNVETCTAGHKNSYCYFTDSAEASSAQKLGLSCGKYRAYLELKELNADISPEQIQNMSMKEICDLINSLYPEGEDPACPEDYKGCGKYRNHNCQNKNTSGLDSEK